MNDRKALKGSASRITSIFSSKDKGEEEKETLRDRQKYMRLNFLMLSSVLKEAKKNLKEQGKRSFSFFPLFTSKILKSENPHLLEITKQAHSCCINQDHHLFPFKQFFLRNEFTMRRVIEWRLSKYIKSKDQLKDFVEVMKETPPDTFRRHLVTLIDQEEKEEGELTKEEIEKAEKEQEARWDLWKHNADGDPFRVSRT